VFANPRARSFLERSDGLRRHERSIVASDPHQGFKLQAAIQHAQQRNRSPLGIDEAGASAPILALERDSGRRALVAAVMPVDAVAVDQRDPAVIIYIFDPERDVRQMLAPICVMYKMTSAEARLAQHLVSGMRITEAAEAMRVQPDTARAYLKQVFSKTGTNRQVDLVRVMLASMLRAKATTDPGGAVDID
jgi:DNA-binding CsgD family transcriptional regulator